MTLIDPGTSPHACAPEVSGRDRVIADDDQAVALDSVSKLYRDGVQALRDVSVDIPEGDRVAIVGPSGSGKSTMLTIMGTLERPSTGRVQVGDTDVGSASDVQLAGLRAHEIGFVFQAFHLQDAISVLDNVALGMLYTGLPLRERRRIGHEALSRVGLSPRTHHRPSQLSGGERQRVAIARAIAKRPRIVLADEPTGNLDSGAGKGVLDLPHELGRDGATLVVVTHDLDIAATFPRQLRMRDGELIEDRRR